MLKRLMMVVVLMCHLTLPVTAGTPLAEEDKRLLMWFDVATIGDAVTTIVGAGCVMVKEVNPILQGASPGATVAFFVARNFIHRMVTKAVPEHRREAWLKMSIGAQMVVVANNVMVLAKYC